LTDPFGREDHLPQLDAVFGPVGEERLEPGAALFPALQLEGVVAPALVADGAGGIEFGEGVAHHRLHRIGGREACVHVYLRRVEPVEQLFPRGGDRQRGYAHLGPVEVEREVAKARVHV
jgi:hypothetical protein